MDIATLNWSIQPKAIAESVLHCNYEAAIFTSGFFATQELADIALYNDLEAQLAYLKTRLPEWYAGAPMRDITPQHEQLTLLKAV